MSVSRSSKFQETRRESGDGNGWPSGRNAGRISHAAALVEPTSEPSGLFPSCPSPPSGRRCRPEGRRSRADAPSGRSGSPLLATPSPHQRVATIRDPPSGGSMRNPGWSDFSCSPSREGAMAGTAWSPHRENWAGLRPAQRAEGGRREGLPVPRWPPGTAVDARVGGVAKPAEQARGLENYRGADVPRLFR